MRLREGCRWADEREPGPPRNRTDTDVFAFFWFTRSDISRSRARSGSVRYGSHARSRAAEESARIAARADCTRTYEARNLAATTLSRVPEHGRRRHSENGRNRQGCLGEMNVQANDQATGY
jgi:hypothetical protein